MVISTFNAPNRRTSHRYCCWLQPGLVIHVQQLFVMWISIHVTSGKDLTKESLELMSTFFFHCLFCLDMSTINMHKWRALIFLLWPIIEATMPFVEWNDNVLNQLDYWPIDRHFIRSSLFKFKNLVFSLLI